MKTAFLFRAESTEQGTPSKLITDGFDCVCIELPWKNNQPQVSCIPKGTYLCTLRQSGKFGLTYILNDVPNRGYILIHGGNYAGDTSKGFKSHSHGCLIMGEKAGYLAGQRAVLNSRLTLQKFMRFMNGENFNLVIQ